MQEKQFTRCRRSSSPDAGEAARRSEKQLVLVYKKDDIWLISFNICFVMKSKRDKKFDGGGGEQDYGGISLKKKL